jgi:hypothetical protein
MGLKWLPGILAVAPGGTILIAAECTGEVDLNLLLGMALLLFAGLCLRRATSSSVEKGNLPNGGHDTAKA